MFRFRLTGPTTIRLRNRATGRTATLDSTGSYAVDTTTGSVAFSGHHVWFWTTGKRVPFAATDGRGAFVAPALALRPGTSRERVLDPCALVGPAASTRPRTTNAPWGLPRSALAQIGRSGLVPVLGALLRHDHAHLDVIVDGRKVVVPGAIGLVEPLDRGACPQGPGSSADCATGHGYFAEVANSPLHTHAPSGIVHIESDRLRAFTLGEFFDEWGVRLDARCVGGALRRRRQGASRLRERPPRPRRPAPRRALGPQEIAVVFWRPRRLRLGALRGYMASGPSGRARSSTRIV